MSTKTIEELETENKALKKENEKLNKPFDLKTISDEDLAKVFEDERIWKHPRFKELNDKAKKGEQLSKLQEEADEKKLMEANKFQEVIDSQKKRIEELETSVNQVKIDSVIRSEAQKAGIVDPDIIVKLLDRTAVKLNVDGTVTGVTEAVKSLAVEKPYLVGKPATPNLGEGTNPAGGGNASPKFKLSQLQDAEFYQKNEKEITEALKTNQVENDMPMGKKIA